MRRTSRRVTSGKTASLLGPGGKLAPAVTTATGVVLGILGSKSGVADAAFHIDPRASFHPGGVAVWLIFGGLGAYVWRDAAARSSADDAHNAQIDQIATVTADISDKQATAPTVEVVEGLYDATRAVNAVQQVLLRTAPGTATAEQIDDSIRTALQAVLTLLQRYDLNTRGQKAIGDVEYTANSAIFRPGADLSEHEATEIATRMPFQGGELDPRRMPGVLDLRQSWSVTSAPTDTRGMDTKVDPLVLQIPPQYSAGNQYLALPGAPTAWCKGDVDVVHDVYDIPERLERDRSGTKLQADKIRQYFDAQAAHIRSFVSIALEPSPDAPHDRLGVLNLNCSVKGMLEDPHAAERIVPLLKSLCVPLSGAVHAALTLLSPVAGDDASAGRWATGTLGQSPADAHAQPLRVIPAGPTAGASGTSSATAVTTRPARSSPRQSSAKPSQGGPGANGGGKPPRAARLPRKKQ